MSAAPPSNGPGSGPETGDADSSAGMSQHDELDDSARRVRSRVASARDSLEQSPGAAVGRTHPGAQQLGRLFQSALKVCVYERVLLARVVYGLRRARLGDWCGVQRVACRAGHLSPRLDRELPDLPLTDAPRQGPGTHDIAASANVAANAVDPTTLAALVQQDEPGPALAWDMASLMPIHAAALLVNASAGGLGHAATPPRRNVVDCQAPNLESMDYDSAAAATKKRWGHAASAGARMVANSLGLASNVEGQRDPDAAESDASSRPSNDENKQCCAAAENE